MKIALIGTGYVGTVAGACFAEAGHHVMCVDTDARKVSALTKGEPLIYEPGLAELLRRNVGRGTLSFTTSVREATEHADVLFMTVGTPSLEGGEADLSFLRQAVIDVARVAKTPKIVVNKSTVPVGTHRQVREWLRAESHVEFEVVSNPEFLREGAALEDFMNPERVVIGTHSAAAFEKMKELYRPFVKDEGTILRMDPVSAELTKYACNAMLATRISFMNEMALLCEKTGADVEALRAGMALDRRIGRHFLQAGMGYGGSCFPKDIRALVSTGEEEGVALRVVRSVDEANELQKRHFLDLIRARYGRPLTGLTLAVWGVAFKDNTDDIREAPALVLIRALAKEGVKVRAYDPMARENAERVLGQKAVFFGEAYEALDGADGLVIATEWNEFRSFDAVRAKELLSQPYIFDGRNLLDPEALAQAGFLYHGVGRGNGHATLEHGSRRTELARPVPLRTAANSGVNA